MRRKTTLTATLIVMGYPSLTAAQTLAQALAQPPAPQNPSPMVEYTRVHERLTPRDIGGAKRTFAGPMGKPVELYVPDHARTSDSLDLVIHFLGAAWLPEQAVAGLAYPTIAAVVNLGAGSGIYDRAFSDPSVFDSLVAGVTREVQTATGKATHFRRVVLVGFSAGHGAVRAILRDPRHFTHIDAVLLLDGMHTSYVPENTPVAAGATLDTTNLVAFANFARAAVRGEKRFLVTHSEIFPGTFASTTETADWLLGALGLHPTPVLRWGPRGMQQLSEAHAGRFELLGFAGNSAPDHVDQLHAMPEFLARLLQQTASNTATVSEAVVALHNGPNNIDLLGDGSKAKVFVAWRGNYNAHGFSTAAFYVRAKSDNAERSDTWQIVPFFGGRYDGVSGRDLYATFQGADCALNDVRLLQHSHTPVEVVLGSRELGKSFADSAPVRFDYYELTRNTGGVTGNPPFYYRYSRTVRARRSYCDVNDAFAHELQLGTTGLAGGDPEH